MIMNIRILPGTGTGKGLSHCLSRNSKFTSTLQHFPRRPPDPQTYGCGSKLNHQGTAGCPSFHLAGFHFGYKFLTHSHMTLKLGPTYPSFAFILRQVTRVSEPNSRSIAKPNRPRLTADRALRATLFSQTVSEVGSSFRGAFFSGNHQTPRGNRSGF